MAGAVEAQTIFEQHEFPTSLFRAGSNHAIDLDGDGDTDIISTSWYDNHIVWFENDGSEAFVQRSIDSNALKVLSAFAIDIDDDGDVDILSVGSSVNWYENDGNENFISHQIGTAAESVYATDLDGDGDVDILASDGSIIWYENDGHENFLIRTIEEFAYGARSISAVDLDGDEDLDVLSSWRVGGHVWHENDGNENFTFHSLGASRQAKSVQGIDFDGDGDIDVLSVDVFYDLAWHENDGNGNFETHVIIKGCGDHNPCSARSAHALDVDGDGDTDVLAAMPNELHLYENDGNEIFTPSILATNVSQSSIRGVDIDSDGDVDVLTIRSFDESPSVFHWYENLRIVLSADEPFTVNSEPILSSNYPNPFSFSATVSYSLQRPSSVILELYDILGKRVRVLERGFKSSGEHEVRFDSEGLSAGVYFVKFTTGGFSQTTKMVLMR